MKNIRREKTDPFTYIPAELPISTESACTCVYVCMQEREREEAQERKYCVYKPYCSMLQYWNAARYPPSWRILPPPLPGGTAVKINKY